LQQFALILLLRTFYLWKFFLLRLAYALVAYNVAFVLSSLKNFTAAGFQLGHCFAVVGGCVTVSC